jgi:hypothetical protein
MSVSKTETPVMQRRAFMLTLGLGGLAATAALVAGKPVQAAEVMQDQSEKPAKKGYQASEHVKTYYRTTRI